MAFGDVGGTLTEFIVTCKTVADGAVAISKGDALALTGAYTVARTSGVDEALFGLALGEADSNDQAIPVLVRGIARFGYVGDAPLIDGVTGVTPSATAGRVQVPASGNGFGRVVKVDTVKQEVQVLL